MDLESDIEFYDKSSVRKCFSCTVLSKQQGLPFNINEDSEK